jgi:hypothetical protein
MKKRQIIIDASDDSSEVDGKHFLLKLVNDDGWMVQEVVEGTVKLTIYKLEKDE